MTNRRKYPLRRITGLVQKPGTHNGIPITQTFELLECGHLGRNTISVGTSLFGSQPALSRRCKKCDHSN